MRGIRAARFVSPFRVRSFRFQWPADMLTSWAFEMETLILGWYVLVETESVFLLTVFGSLQFLGTLIAPMIGLVGDRIGRRTMLCLMRAFYAVMAATLMTVGLMDALSPYYVFAVAGLVGLVRPSDLVMRNALIGDTMPFARLTQAMGLARTTQDSARIAGALVGAGLFSVLGIGPTYIFVTGFYAASFIFTLGVSKVRPVHGEPAQIEPHVPDDPPIAPKPASFWQELREGLVYVWQTPRVLAVMWLAFLVNLSAYPVTSGLLPYVAKEIYSLDENGLGRLVAGYAAGALTGSLMMALTGGARNSARLMVFGILVWYSLVLVLGQLETVSVGMPLLVLIGMAQTTGMVSMSVTLLRTIGARFRGRVMGVRTLAIYGLPVGLMAAGALIDWIGFAAAITVYAITGMVLTVLTAIRWRTAIWH
jgi:MFS family permease